MPDESITGLRVRMYREAMQSFKDAEREKRESDESKSKNDEAAPGK